MYHLFRFIAITGNVLYFLWILYNGINEGFKATPIEFVSYLGLLLLLILNTFLFLRKEQSQ
jgi:hypothetical protein